VNPKVCTICSAIEPLTLYQQSKSSPIFKFFKNAPATYPRLLLSSFQFEQYLHSGSPQPSPQLRRSQAIALRDAPCLSPAMSIKGFTSDEGNGHSLMVTNLGHFCLSRNVGVDFVPQNMSPPSPDRLVHCSCPIDAFLLRVSEQQSC
jgi:hypothetical protein